jgi:hypothetical protein
MSTPAVIAALRAGRDAVANGSAAFFRALPDCKGDEFWVVDRLLHIGLRSVCIANGVRPIDLDQATRLRAYDLAIAAAGGESEKP